MLCTTQEKSKLKSGKVNFSSPFNNLKKLFKLNLNKQSTKTCHSTELNSESQLFEKKTKKPEEVRK